MNVLKRCKLVSPSQCGLRVGQPYYHNVVFLYHLLGGYEKINSINALYK